MPYTLEEVEKLKAQGRAQEKPKGYTLEEVEQMKRSGRAQDVIPPEEKSFGQKAAETAVEIGEFIDKYSGAPTRAAVGGFLSKPSSIYGKDEGRLERAGKAFVSQFGEDPSLAPTGKELNKMAGLELSEKPLSERFPSLYTDSDDFFRLKFKKGGLLDPSPAGAAGLATDVVTDWSNVVPIGKAAKLAGEVGVEGLKTTGKLAKEGTGLLAKGAAKTADVLTGTKAGTRVLKAGENVAEGVSDIVGKVRGRINPKAERYLSIAEKHGIDPNILPSSIKYEGSIPLVERAVAMGPGGEDIYGKIGEAFQKVDEAFETQVRKIGNEFVDPVATGDLLSNAYKNAKDNLFNDTAVRYSQLHKLAPGMPLLPEIQNKLYRGLNGIEKKAKGLALRGATADQKAAGKEIMEVVSQLRKAKNVKQLGEQITYIGQAAFANPVEFAGRLRPDQKALQEIYGHVQDALIASADEISPEVGAMLRNNNAAIHDFIEKTAPIREALESKSLAPEKLYKAVSSDTKRLQAIADMLPPEELKSFKGALINGVFKYDKNGSIIYGSSRKALQKEGYKLAKVLSPQEMNDLDELLELGERLGDRLDDRLKPTGMVQMFKNLPEAVVQNLVSKKGLDIMKKTAEGTTQATKKLPSNAGLLELSMPADILQSYKKGLLKEKTTPGYGLLKGMQSTAPSQYREKK